MLEPITIERIPKEAVETLWPQVETFIEEALNYANGELFTEDVLDDLLSGKMQLLIAARGYRIFGACVTCIVSYHRIDRIRVIAMGGNFAIKWLRHLRNYLLDWCKRGNFDGIEAFCKPDDRYLQLLEFYGAKRGYVVALMECE